MLLTLHKRVSLGSFLVGKDLLPLFSVEVHFNLSLDLAVVLLPFDAAITIEELGDEFLDIDRRLINPVLQPTPDFGSDVRHSQNTSDIIGGFIFSLLAVFSQFFFPFLVIETGDDIVIGSDVSHCPKLLCQSLLGLMPFKPFFGLSDVPLTLSNLSRSLDLAGTDRWSRSVLCHD